jgi:gluconolactonase
MSTFLLLLFGAFLEGELPHARHATPIEVLRLPSYTEGVVFDLEGTGYVSETNGRFVTRFTPDGKSAAWAEVDKPNGHKVLPDGTCLLWVPGAVWHLDRNGEVLSKASAECDDKPLRKPNDLTIDLEGGFYFTDPEGSMRQPTGTICYVDATGKTHPAAGGLMFPNGIVLRPDGRKLLVAESAQNRILVFAVSSPGKLGPPRVFANLPAKGEGQINNQPDGMCLDVEGNLYVADYGMGQVQVLDPTGRFVRTYQSGILRTSNVAFSGPAMEDLYITGGVDANPRSQGVIFRFHLPGVRGLAIPIRRQGPVVP